MKLFSIIIFLFTLVVMISATTEQPKSFMEEEWEVIAENLATGVVHGLSKLTNQMASITTKVNALEVQQEEQQNKKDEKIRLLGEISEAHKLVTTLITESGHAMVMTFNSELRLKRKALFVQVQVMQQEIIQLTARVKAIKD